MTFWWMASAAWAVLPPCAPLSGEHIVTLGITAHGHSFGGLGIVEFREPDWTFTALSPAGPAMFTIQHIAGETQVWSAFPEWTPWLAAMPFDRDLRLIHSEDRSTCSAGTGRLVVRPDRQLRRGAPGPARVVVREDGARVLTDSWRGYTLTMKASEGAR